MRIPVLSAVFLAVLFAGCHQPTSSASLTSKQVAQLVLPLQASVVSTQTGIKLSPGILAAQVDASISGSRAITPGNLVTASGTQAFSSSVTPSQMYNSSSATTSTRRFPASGYYYDATSVQTDTLYFFYLTPVSGSTTKFTIQLYDYPMADFSVYYVYENYVVDNSNTSSTTAGVWAWTPENSAGTLGSENSIVTYYLDGTNDGGASILATSISSPAVLYGALSPNIASTPSSYTDSSSAALYSDPTVQAAYANYSFPSAFTDTSLAGFSTYFDSLVPSGTKATESGGSVTVPGTTWSSKSLVSSTSPQKLTYYTEVAPSTGSPYQYAYGLIYATDEASGSSNYDRTVTRYMIDFANKAQYYRSLTATGAKWNGGGPANSNLWQFTAVKKNLAQNSSGLITLNQSYQIWYAPSTMVSALSSDSTRAAILNTAPGMYLGFTVTQQSSGSFNYSGTMNWLWNGYGNTYSVTVSGGVACAVWTGLTTQSAVTGDTSLSSNPRTTTTSSTPSYLSSSVSVPLQSFGTTLSIPVNGGTFVGTFDGTQFVGSFVYGGSSTHVVVNASTVTASGTTYTPSQIMS